MKVILCFGGNLRFTRIFKIPHSKDFKEINIFSYTFFSNKSFSFELDSLKNHVNKNIDQYNNFNTDNNQKCFFSSNLAN